jgi:hypothetical protein
VADSQSHSFWHFRSPQSTTGNASGIQMCSKSERRSRGSINGDFQVAGTGASLRTGARRSEHGSKIAFGREGKKIMRDWLRLKNDGSTGFQCPGIVVIYRQKFRSTQSKQTERELPRGLVDQSALRDNRPQTCCRSRGVRELTAIRGICAQYVWIECS